MTDKYILSSHPQIVILDIDGTILGDVSPQILLYELSKIKELNIKITKKFIINRLKQGIIRKGFKSFIKNSKNIEFFIYTAADHRWAIFIVKCIEEVLNITFNKPIFSRNNCLIINNNLKKDINVIKEKIILSLSKKYNKPISLENIMMIDNTKDVYNTYNDNLLVCNTYNYRVIENLPFYIEEKLYDKYYKNINEIINLYYPMNITTTNYFDFQKQFYRYYIKYLDYIKKNNIKDNFFEILQNIIYNKRIYEFNLKSIDYIRNNI